MPSASVPDPARRRPARPPDLRVDIPSRVEYLDLLEELVVAFAVAHGFAPDAAVDLGLAARESLTNAIRHGSGLDPARRVKMQIAVREPGSLVIRVCDQGPGFDPERLPDPRAPENLVKGCGRGIFFMRQLTDGVSFSFPRRGGTVVRLRKGLAPGPCLSEPSRQPPSNTSTSHRRS